MPLKASRGCVHELVEAECLRRPRSVAVTFQQDSLTYGELHRKSNCFAQALSRAGVGRGARVGLYVDRSMGMVIALLAILKVGGAYVPADPAHGGSRIEQIAGEDGFTFLIAERQGVDHLPNT